MVDNDGNIDYPLNDPDLPVERIIVDEKDMELLKKYHNLNK